jgi:thiaminase/transcriptional activator TenA
VSFTEDLRKTAATTWEKAIGHRFFREVAADTVEDGVFRRYLRVEYGFVDCAARVLGYAVAKAPSFAERTRLAFGLHGLVTDQQDYFRTAFEAAGIPPDQRAAVPPDARSKPLHDVFLEAAEKHGYEEILACILAAEWMYLTWCSDADRTPSRRKHLRDWVGLHAGGAFAEHVAWVRGELDRRGPLLPAARRAALHRLFESALAAEILFHDAAYTAD